MDIGHGHGSILNNKDSTMDHHEIQAEQTDEKVNTLPLLKRAFAIYSDSKCIAFQNFICFRRKEGIELDA